MLDLILVKQCEQQIENALQNLAAINNDGLVEPASPKTSKQPPKNKLNFDAQTYLQKIHGVDVTAIYGISEIAAMEIFAETGADFKQMAYRKSLRFLA